MKPWARGLVGVLVIVYILPLFLLQEQHPASKDYHDDLDTPISKDTFEDMKFSTSLAIAAAASSASAHTIFTSLNGGAVGDGVRVPSYDGVSTLPSTSSTSSAPPPSPPSLSPSGELIFPQPITEVTSNDIACNGGPNPTTATSKVITVAAGSKATLTWRHTLTSGSNDVIDASHKGPVMAYLKKVSNAVTDSGVGGTSTLIPRYKLKRET
jgi:hypothetical protein